jgi:hypothetical protein
MRRFQKPSVPGNLSDPVFLIPPEQEHEGQALWHVCVDGMGQSKRLGQKEEEEGAREFQRTPEF